MNKIIVMYLVRKYTYLLPHDIIIFHHNYCDGIQYVNSLIGLQGNQVLGQCEVSSTGHYSIKLNYTMLGNKLMVLATLYHEIAHGRLNYLRTINNDNTARDLALKWDNYANRYLKGSLDRYEYAY